MAQFWQFITAIALAQVMGLAVPRVLESRIKKPDGPDFLNPEIWKALLVARNHGATIGFFERLLLYPTP